MVVVVANIMEKFKTNNTNVDPFIRNTEDTNPAKFGHINAIVDVITELQNTPSSLGYQRLTFNLTQSGTDAPVVDILLNEVDAVFTSEYNGVGSYIFNWNLNVSDLTKVQLFPPGTTSVGILIATVGALRFIIQTFDTSGGNTDDLLLNSSFEVRFYPGWDA